jgi:hypothetical protein
MPDMTDSPVLTNIGPAELARRESEARRATEESTLAAEETLISGLSAHIDTRWTDAKQAKITVEAEMIAARDQRKGAYSPQKLAEIRSVKQPEIFMNITGTKCRNAMAQIKDIVIVPGQRIFAVDPTPVPELPDDIQGKIEDGVVKRFLDMAVSQAQQTGQSIPSDQLRMMIMDQADEIKKKIQQQIVRKSKELAESIADQIDDHFAEGGFYTALEAAIDDIVVYKAGIIKGPIFRMEKVRRISRDAETGRITRTVETKIVPQYDRRSPFNIFPSPRSTGVDAGDLFDVISIRPRHLANLRSLDGYDSDAIDRVLAEFQRGALKDGWLGLSSEAWDGINEESDDAPDSRAENIYCLEFWGEIPGQTLLDWGMTAEEIEDPLMDYPVCVWKIGTHIIKAMLNYDSLGRKPFSKTSFETDNDSFWGEGVPEKIADCQQVCNACARSILSNVGMGALPQTAINVDRLEPGSSRDDHPGKKWYLTEEQMGSSTPPIAWYQPPMVTEQLIRVYTTFSKIADEHSGVPGFAHGDSQVGGAGNTSSGLAQLRAMAAQGLRAVIRNIDLDFIVPALERHYDYLLDNTEIYGLLGDYKLSARGTSSLLAKDQETQRQMEYTNYTANPMDAGLVGMENRRRMLFQVAKNLGIDLDETAPPTPIPAAPPGVAPEQAPVTLDAAGNPAQGVDNRQFNPERPRLEASTPGNAGGAGGYA